MPAPADRLYNLLGSDHLPLITDLVRVRSKTVEFYILNSRGFPAIGRQPIRLPHD